MSNIGDDTSMQGGDLCLPDAKINAKANWHFDYES